MNVTGLDVDSTNVVFLMMVESWVIYRSMNVTGLDVDSTNVVFF